MRGQITLEFILLFAIFLAFLIIWLPTITKARDDIIRTMASFYKANVLAAVRNAADEICILGPGNSRAIDITLLEDAVLSARENSISLSDGYGSVAEQTRCGMSTTSITVRRGRLVLENADGELVLTFQS